MTLLTPARHNISIPQKQALWAPTYAGVDEILNITKNGRALMVPIGDPAFEDSLTAPTKVTTRFSEAVDFTYTNSGRHLWATKLGYEGPGQIPVLHFDGATDWLETPDAPFWNDTADGGAPNEPSYCWAVWVYVVGTDNQAVFAKSPNLSATGTDWTTFLGSAKWTTRLIDDNVNAFIGSITNALSEGWHQLVTTYSGTAAASGLITYIDGVADRSDQASGSYVAQEDGTTVVRVGAESDGSSPLSNSLAGGTHGPIFEPVGAGAVWTPDQVLALYQLQAPQLIYGWTA